MWPRWDPELVALPVIATGAPVLATSTAVQVVWLVALAPVGLRWLTRRRPPGPERGDGRPGLVLTRRQEAWP